MVFLLFIIIFYYFLFLGELYVVYEISE